MEKILLSGLVTDMNLVSHYKKIINNILINEFSLQNEDIKNISFEFPKDLSLGDFSTNAAMVLAGKLRKSPSEIAENIRNLILKNSDIENAEIAGKGFINITIKKEIWQKLLLKIIEKKSSYGDEGFGKKEKLILSMFRLTLQGPFMLGILGAQSLETLYQIYSLKLVMMFVESIMSTMRVNK